MPSCRFPIHLLLFVLGVVAIGRAQDRATLETMARQGDVRAMITLGVQHHTGDGVPVDYAKAMDWYLPAYARKDGDALNNLGVLHRDGLGVPKNPRLAYALFLAVHMERLGSEATQIRAGRNLTRLAQSLPPAEIHEALSYTWPYVDQLVKSRGANRTIGRDVLPTKKQPRLRDHAWWSDAERQAMTFASPPPWDKPE